MSSTVTTRPTHYAVLGLEPTATRAEISRAFTREMSMLRPRAFGGLAELTVAHAVLSDEARRRAYDREIGLAPPAPDPKPALPLHTHGAGSASFARAAIPLAAAAERPAIALAPQPEERPTPAPRTRPIGEALAALAQAEPLTARPGPEPVFPEPVVTQPVKLAVTHYDPDDAGEARAAAWRPLLMAGGGLVAVVALIGAWAGWQSRGGVPEKASVSALLTPPNTDFTVSDPAAAARESDVVPPPPSIAPVQAARHRGERKAVARARPTPQLAAIEQQLAEPAPAESAVAPAVVPAAADATEPVSATAASLPLSNATIARTIGRIGYPCGSVASTTQILGKSFTVTCTSGHSYRAAPVRGRYHFRRLASR